MGGSALKLLVFGETGQVARELQRACPEAIFAGRGQADLDDPAGCAALIRRLRPEAIVNAAAYTAVDRAESEPDLAMAVNGHAPAAMARAAREIGAVMVHISTDYVFDGAGERAFAPQDAPAPLGVYGASKLLGERGVMQAGGAHVILRTSWVFSAHGTNFVKTMLRLGVQRPELRVVADQIGGPTPAAAIARACLTAAERLRAAPDLSGIYHFAGGPWVSWAGFARAIMTAANLRCDVHEIPSRDYPTPARRPLNSRLDCADLARLGLSAPDWRAGLAEVLVQLQS